MTRTAAKLKEWRGTEWRGAEAFVLQLQKMAEDDPLFKSREKRA
ncbi:hypothetical protein AB0C52_24825 [Streptomyces sp. NPDC048717]